MNRKEFIKTCGLACVGSLAFGTFLQSCASIKMVDGIIKGENIIVPVSEFEIVKDQKKSFLNYIIVQNNQLQFPITVYRINESQYSALLMRCTHQGNELTAYGDKLQCSAHGSEFDKQGNATNGPAEDRLRKFPVSIENQQLKISIKVE
ncbi:MAG: (2Fe-2S)-binding protein [Lutibacter sp.]|nr:MAG: (2Fe-2S)-binding protein [Lutibacter sp.]